MAAFLSGILRLEKSIQSWLNVDRNRLKCKIRAERDIIPAVLSGRGMPPRLPAGEEENPDDASIEERMPTPIGGHRRRERWPGRAPG
jgi:hypothetical protein